MHWHDLIPLQFRFVSGVRDYEFKTRFFHPRYSANADTLPAQVKLGSIFCDLVISRAKDPTLFEAMKRLLEVDGETNRELRYMTVHNAYEALVRHRDIDITSIRHSFAHPADQLTHPAVIQSLNKRFGSTEINLREHSHKREYFRCLGGMLVVLDQVLARELELRSSAGARQASTTQRNVKH